MKKNIKKIISSAIVLLAVVGFVSTVNAFGAFMYVSQENLTKLAGEVFTASVGFNTAGDKVCAAEGTLIFDNVSCQSITLADGVIAQTLPSCSNPSFLIGVPSCTTENKELFKVSAKVGDTGTAAISLSRVDVIGEGVSVGSTSISGRYTINTAPALVFDSTPSLKITPTLNSTLRLNSTPTPDLVQALINNKKIELFDIKLNINNSILVKSSDLTAQVRFESFGNVPTPVDLTYRIVDSLGKEVYSEKGNVTVETEQLITKDFRNLDLKDGNYSLVLTIVYGNNVVDNFTQDFQVKLGIAGVSPLKKNTAIVLIVITMSILIIYLRRRYKK